VISPLLANIYLHHVFDLWAERWRRLEARSDMIVVRYADDLVAGFEHPYRDPRPIADMRQDQLSGWRFAKVRTKLRNCLSTGDESALHEARSGSAFGAA
jgi:hypothetical protein